jgi:succinate dehydrogenase / fumarate reductase membrane anchor subunit
LAQVLGSGSAKDGTEHWWAQRVTAVALLILGGWFLFSIMRLDSFAHSAMLEWAGRPFNSVMLVLLSVTLAWHSALGVQVVLEDYVHGPFIKVVSLLANRFAHVFLAITAVVAVLTIALGSSA